MAQRLSDDLHPAFVSSLVRIREMQVCTVRGARLRLWTVRHEITCHVGVRLGPAA